MNRIAWAVLGVGIGLPVGPAVAQNCMWLPFMAMCDSGMMQMQMQMPVMPNVPMPFVWHFQTPAQPGATTWAWREEALPDGSRRRIWEGSTVMPDGTVARSTESRIRFPDGRECVERGTRLDCAGM